MTATRDRRLIVFCVVAAFGVATEVAISQAASLHAARVSLAMLVDLVVVLPAFFAVVVLRPARRPLLDVLPVIALGTFGARLLLAGRPEVKVVLQGVTGVVELVVLAALLRRLRAAVTQVRGVGGDDLLVRLGAVTDPLSRIAAAELAVLYYAFVGPRIRRQPRPEEFGYVESSGLGGLLFGLGLLLALEGVSVHFFLRAWSPRASWVHAALNGYGLVWLVALYQAARLRPVVVSEKHVLIRTSLLWTIDVPRAVVAAVADITARPLPRGTLRAAVGAVPGLLLTLVEPVVATGPFGIRRTVTRIGLHLDEPSRFRAALG